MTIFNIKWEWTIPNLLSILRLILLPVFVALFFMGDRDPMLLYGSFGVLILSGLTDLFDGMIARKFHQISDMGKLLDPLADKLTQVVVVLCLAIKYPPVISLLVICVVKELTQAIGGLFLLQRGEQIRGAKWYGKVSTFVFYGAMALIVLLPDRMPPWLFISLIVLVAAFMLFAFFNYMKVFFRIHRALPSRNEEDGRDEEK
ncbi:MAG: CDP-alcohol phosphatidyltransferase family protein [Clostridiales bacterium]|nr:CDP-alcohol phosphatidyltransferase family protein [Clostridiales bacterium]